MRVMVAIRQLNLAALCVALVFCSATAQSVVNDENALIDLAFQTYYKAINVSGWHKLVHCRLGVITKLL